MRAFYVDMQRGPQHGEQQLKSSGSWPLFSREVTGYGVAVAKGEPGELSTEDSAYSS